MSPHRMTQWLLVALLLALLILVCIAISNHVNINTH
jgi:disulfide bond formation protein DsbB